MEGEVKYVLTDDDDVEKEIKVLTKSNRAEFILFFRETQPVVTSVSWR